MGLNMNAYLDSLNHYTQIKEEIEKYEDMIDNHDCHMSKDDGCACARWQEEIRYLKDQLKRG